ncbi:uncharacterized protein LOC106663658 isoform X2 [Cimex lectularius]|uniref:Uncharacterized protein n=1 Tax=Cimex lectularius TaxID=79782 RepID=A0A8I6RFX3_CIMLE|nr:uncharacterized protein LOC106663658 isoform X2 [Cimex lectularius]
MEDDDDTSSTSSLYSEERFLYIRNEFFSKVYALLLIQVITSAVFILGLNINLDVKKLLFEWFYLGPIFGMLSFISFVLLMFVARLRNLHPFNILVTFLLTSSCGGFAGIQAAQDQFHFIWCGFGSSVIIFFILSVDSVVIYNVLVGSIALVAIGGIAISIPILLSIECTIVSFTFSVTACIISACAYLYISGVYISKFQNVDVYEPEFEKKFTEKYIFASNLLYTTIFLFYTHFMGILAYVLRT